MFGQQQMRETMQMKAHATAPAAVGIVSKAEAEGAIGKPGVTGIGRVALFCPVAFLGIPRCGPASPSLVSSPRHPWATYPVPRLALWNKLACPREPTGSLETICLGPGC